MRLGPATIEDHLARCPVARLATVSDDDRPHQVPVVFARTQDRLWSPVDGKPKAGSELTRVRNILARPDVSLLLDEYREDWNSLWWIRIDARAEIIRPATADRPDIAAALAALQAKYPQYAAVPLLGPGATLIAFDPASIVSWTAGGN